MGDVPVLSPVNWSTVVKEKPTVVSPLFGAFPSLQRRRMSTYISLLMAAILVNYTSEFRELFEATTYFKSANHKQVCDLMQKCQCRNSASFGIPTNHYCGL
jgi:hypothetical protein